MLYNGDYYCINCLHSFRTAKKRNLYEDVCKDFDYCYIEMPEVDKNILKHNHGKKYMKILFAIYAYTESLLEKNTFIL